MTVTMVIIGLIAILFFYSLSNKNNRIFKTEIISLGVLGTFIGIAHSLYGFDATNIKDSIPILLDGLKTAFITSGVGMFTSILLSIIKPPVKESNNELIQALEIVVKDFNKNLTEQFGENFKELNSSVVNLIQWQDNYKSQITQTEASFKNTIEQLNKIVLLKENEEKNIINIIKNLEDGTKSIQKSLEETTSIVEENLQLLLREANGKL